MQPSDEIPKGLLSQTVLDVPDAHSPSLEKAWLTFCMNGLVVLCLICSTLEEEKQKWIGLEGVVVDRVPPSVCLGSSLSTRDK